VCRYEALTRFSISIAFQRRALPITCVRQSIKNCNSWREYSAKLWSNNILPGLYCIWRIELKDFLEMVAVDKNCQNFPLKFLAGHVLVIRVHIHFVPHREYGFQPLWWQVGEFYVGTRLFVIVRIVLQNKQMYNVASLQTSTNKRNLTCTGIIHNRYTKFPAASLKFYLFLACWAFIVLMLRVPCIMFKSTPLALEYIQNRCKKFRPHKKNFCASVVYTGCFTTLGHNCRRWFRRSLWSKKFI